MKAKQKNWCRRWDSNPRPRDYETLALPLSYTGKSPALPPSYGLLGGRVKREPPRPPRRRDEKRGGTRAQPSVPPHRTDCPAEEPSANRRAARAGEMRRGELQEPSPRSLLIVRIARRKSQARTAAPPAPQR